MKLEEAAYDDLSIIQKKQVFIYHAEEMHAEAGFLQQGAISQCWQVINDEKFI